MSKLQNDPGVTATSMFAANATGAAIVVVPKGTTVPLPNYQILNSFTKSNGNRVFTVPATGQYVIYYTFSLAEGVPGLAARVLVNDEPLAPSIISPAATTTNFLLTFIVELNEGDTLQTQLYGPHSVVVLNEGVGAALTVVQLS